MTEFTYANSQEDKPLDGEYVQEQPKSDEQLNIPAETTLKPESTEPQRAVPRVELTDEQKQKAISRSAGLVRAFPGSVAAEDGIIQLHPEGR